MRCCRTAGRATCVSCATCSSARRYCATTGRSSGDTFRFNRKLSRLQSTSNLGAMERQTIENVLRETDGNKAKTARRLGLTRTQLYVRLRRYGLENC